MDRGGCCRDLEPGGFLVLKPEWGRDMDMTAEGIQGDSVGIRLGIAMICVALQLHAVGHAWAE